MSGETLLPVIGNLTSDPELRYTQNGKAVANVTVAAGERRFNKATNAWEEGDTLFMRLAIWGELGEHAASSLVKGNRVIVYGRLKQRSYETKPVDGSAPEKRSSMELVVDEIGPSLRYATAVVHRVSRDVAPGDEPWRSDAANSSAAVV